MTGMDKLKNLIEEHDGIISSKLVEENNIHREYLRQMVLNGELERAARGVYILPEVLEDEMLILQLKNTRIIYSHESALLLHDLTDRVPFQHVATVPYGYNPTRLKAEGLLVHTVKKDLIDVGICSKKTIFGNEVKTYDVERTICDIFKDRNNQDIEIVLDALKRYFRRKDRDLNKLMKYAELLKIKNILMPYLRALI
ncbi:type IV toxin-antitoxin system AbiEi family antitoxin domain-containing protein [Anaerotalea alkaliphila]|uniref:Abortive phage infection protein n=1 Tax=Anaerotalea alkaliphila TaxID=2662126 RepID=A0A7X5KNC6_9FIRM|nr:type IV toxin-antitoxin system AbiEi family antitoxin domain-containing protein [Anaerotalea alkaliphila]NDL67889.1 abortive phage infection protein [Anaerotalea alkaliphila]